MTDRVKIKADIMWAHLNKMNDVSERYQVDLCNLSDNAAKALEDMGITVYQKDGKGYYITCKSKNPIRAYDKDGMVMNGETVGNGSQAICLVSFYSWVFKNKEGVSPSLQKLVITKLEEYGGDVEKLVLQEDDDEIL